jgi:hypothetical protein
MTPRRQGETSSSWKKDWLRGASPFRAGKIGVKIFVAGFEALYYKVN